jgi:hypothetical protein
MGFLGALPHQAVDAFLADHAWWDTKKPPDLLI